MRVKLCTLFVLYGIDASSHAGGAGVAAMVRRGFTLSTEERCC